MRDRIVTALVAAVSGALLVGGIAAAPAVAETRVGAAVPAPVTVRLPEAAHVVGGAFGPFTLSATAKVVHVVMPPDVRSLSGLYYVWGSPDPYLGWYPEPTSGTPIPDGTTELDVPVPSSSDGTLPSHLLIKSNTAYAAYDDTALSSRAWLDAEFSYSATTGPVSVTADLRDVYRTDVFHAAAPITVAAGGTIRFVGAAGEFTKGPRRLWTSPNAPAVEFTGSRTGQKLSWSVSADGSTLSVKAPSILPAGEDTSKDYLSVDEDETGSKDSIRLAAQVKVTGAGHALVPVARPWVSGTLKVGAVLRAHPGSWAPVQGEAVDARYQWLRDGRPVTFATGSAYKLTAADAGHRIGLRVTAQSYPYTAATVTVTTAADVVGLAAPRAVTAPSITGKAAVAQLLTAHAGRWAPAPKSFTYQWYRAGKPIAGATRATYRTTAADRGRAISLRITAHLYGHTNGTATSRSVTIR